MAGRIRFVTAAGVCAAVLVALAAVTPARAVPAGGMSAAQVASMFGAYGDAGGHWTGGDSTVSVLLPDGRVAWLFSDTFLGTVNPDGSRPQNTPMVNNTLVVQDGSVLVETRHGGTASWPEALVRPAQEHEFFWVADGIVESGALKVLYNRYKRYGSGSLEVELTGTSLATFALPGLTLTAVADLPLGKAVTWGSALLADGSYTYVYGASSGLGGLKFGHVARVPAGGLGGGWQFWTGTAWSATMTDAARLLSGVGNAFGVQKVGSQYVLATQESNAIFDPQFVAYTAPSPTGPFSGPIPLLTAPEQQPGNNRFAYVARLHPDLARPGKLLMSYDLNSMNIPDVYADARLYRPRFVELDWPRPAGPPVAAPTGLAATPDPAGVVHLQWTAVSGATGYYVYRRDVTGGQTHFLRQWQRVTQASADVNGLVTGHRYEFRVTAANGVGEGPLSTVAAATARIVRDASIIDGANTPRAVPGTYIVRFQDRPGTRERGVEAFARELLNQSGGTLDRLFPLTLNGFSATMTEAQAIDLAGHPDVLDVQQDQTMSLQGEQRNPPSWGLDRIDQRHPILDQLYRYPNDARDVHAYVIDTGILRTHTDFRFRATRGPNFTGDNIDDDCNGHGTHVAGTLGGAEFGVAKMVRITGVKVLDCRGEGTNRTVIQGLEWVVANAQRPAVINMSLGAPTFVSPTRPTRVDNAVQKAVAAGITVVAAAGNDNTDACSFTPARAADAITVGAINRDGRRWVHIDPSRGSNFGSCVDVFAPGVDILSAYYRHDDDTQTATGTSMATPHVAGTVAMILQAHPDYSPAEVTEALLQTATPGAVGDPAGSPNLLLFVEQPPTHAPTLTATPNPDGTIGLEWTAVPEPKVHYLVSQRDVTAGETTFTRWRERFTGTKATAKSLEEGHTYEFTVAASNSTGTGPESNVASAEARTQPPGPPTNLTATANPDDGTITLRWEPPGANLWFNVYMRDVTAGQADFVKLPIPVTTCCTFVGGLLTHDHEYEFQVTAINRGGEGPPSNTARARSHYPVPAPPTNVTATEGDSQVQLRWTASPTPNVWYLAYMRDVTAGETEFTQLPLPITTCCVWTGGLLANEHTYEFKLTAIGQGGESLPSNTVRATPHKVPPPQVTGLTATSNTDGTILLRWTEPAGGPYWYEIYMRDVTAGETAFTRLGIPVTECCSWTGGLLSHNHEYEFKVGATNGRSGPPSDPVRATSRYSLPDPPVNLRGQSAGDGFVDLDWDPPGPGGFYYWTYWRDATTGQAWIKNGYPTDKTSASLGPFVHGHVYEFKVSAHNQAGEGPATAPIPITSVGGLPAAPTGLTAQAGDGKVTLRWTASPTPNVWYLIEWRSAGGTWLRQSLPVTTCCTAEVGWLLNGTTYEFRLRATNASGDSPASNVAGARPMPPFPQPPSGLSAQAGDGKVTLRWTASPTPNVWYVVDMRANGGAWQRLPYPITNCCTWEGGLLANGTTYEFRLRSTNLSGDSAPSNVVSARPMPPFPQPPSGLTAAPGDGTVTLRWNASPTPNVWYWVEMRPAGGNWTRLPIPIVNCCTFTGGWLSNGTTYEWRVRSTNLSGDSAPSNVASARPMPPVPAPPANLTARAGNSSVELAWSPSPTPNVMYYIHSRNATRNEPWVRSLYPVAQTAWTVSYLKPGETYEFRVTAANYWFEGAPSNVARITTRRTGCWVIPVTPDIVDYAVQVSNITSCIGPVYNVTVTVYMWHFRIIEGWIIRTQTTANWGFVSPGRMGAAVARGAAAPMHCYITQATTRWTWPDGRPGEATLYSPTTYLGPIGRGNCNGIGGF